MFRQIVLFVCLSVVFASKKSVSRELAANEPSLNQDEFGAEALMAHNLYRKIHGVSALKLNQKLVNLAVARAQELATDGKLNVKQILFNRENLGETVGTVGGFSSYNGISATQLWYSVVSKFDEEGESSNEGASFTQMVWKKTREVGFGISKGKDGKFYFVAEYFPSGNIRGQYEENVFQLTEEEMPATVERERNSKCVNQTVVEMWRKLLTKAKLSEEVPTQTITSTVAPIIEPIIGKQDKIEKTEKVEEVENVEKIEKADKKLKSSTSSDDTEEQRVTSTKRLTTTTKTTTTTTTEEPSTTVRITTKAAPKIETTTIDDTTEKTTFSTRRTTTTTEEMETTKASKPKVSRPVATTDRTIEHVEEVQTTTKRQVKLTTPAPVDPDTLITNQVEVEITTKAAKLIEKVEKSTKSSKVAQKVKEVESTTVKPAVTATTINPDLIITTEPSEAELIAKEMELQRQFETTTTRKTTTTTIKPQHVEEEDKVTKASETKAENLARDEETVVEKSTISPKITKEVPLEDDEEEPKTTTKKTQTKKKLNMPVVNKEKEEENIDSDNVESATRRSMKLVSAKENDSEETTTTKKQLTKARISPTILDESIQRPSKSKLLETITNSEEVKPRTLQVDSDEPQKPKTNSKKTNKMVEQEDEETVSKPISNRKVAEQDEN